MKRINKIIFLFIMLCIIGIPKSFAATTTVDIPVSGKYNYGYTNDIFKIMNEERKKVGVSNLELDAYLSDMALIRAKEVSVYFAHTRSNGDNIFTSINKLNGENIIAGYSTPKTIMQGWMSSQGHKENILHEAFKSTGVGCYQTSNSIYYCVQLFSVKPADSDFTKTGISALKRETVKLSNEFLDFKVNIYPTNLTIGETITVKNAYISNLGTSSSYFDILIPASKLSWKSLTPDVLTVKNNSIKAIDSGTGKVKVTLGNVSHTYEISVERKDIADAKASLKYAVYAYTGKSVKPNVTVKYGSATLKKGEDYTVSYKNNKNIGNASITITGIGKYKGKLTKTFKISTNSVKKFTTSTKTTNSITLKWSKPTGDITGYRIYRSTSKNGTYKLIKTITNKNTLSYKNSNLNSGTTYYYKIRAYKKINNKLYYSKYTYLTNTTKLKTPSIKLTSNNKKVTVKYNKINGATKYQVYYKTSKNGTYKRLTTTSKLSYTKANLTKGKTYYFKLRAYKDVSGTKIYSPFSTEKTIKVK